MKRIFLLLGIVALLASCNNAKKEKADDKAVAEIPAVVDQHTARTSLDVDGTYTGNLPSASGSGMEVTITLSGDNYKKSIVYTGKSDKPFEKSGKYTWDSTGYIITLEGDEVPNKYFVGENTLTQRDINGEKITGDLANMYILRK